MLHYPSPEARRLAAMVQQLEKLKQQGATPGSAPEIIAAIDTHGAALIAVLQDGRNVYAMDARRISPGQVLDVPNIPAPESPRRAVYICPTCRRAYLDALPAGHEHARPGDTLPGPAFVLPCPTCAAMLKANGIDFETIQAEELDHAAAEERRARAESRASAAARRLVNMPPASLSKN